LNLLPRFAAVSAQSLVARSINPWFYLNCHCRGVAIVGPQRRAENVVLNLFQFGGGFDIAGFPSGDACGALFVPL